MRPVGHLGLALLGTAVVCVVALHLVRRDQSPVDRHLSEYAIGPDGWLMDVALVAAAGGFAAVAALLAGSPEPPRFVPAALAAAAAGLVLSAVFQLDADDATEHAIHRVASGVAATAAVAAAVAWSVVGVGRRRGGRRGVERPIALLASVAVVLGPALQDTDVRGIHQRVTWAVLIAWAGVVTTRELDGDRRRAGRA